MPRSKKDARAKWTKFFMFLATPPGNGKNAQRTLHGSDRTSTASDRGQPCRTRHTLPARPVFRQCLHQIAANGDYNGRAAKRKMCHQGALVFHHGVTETRRKPQFW